MIVLATFIIAALQAAPCDSKDKTGLHWVLPFTKAREAAVRDHRLLLVKPIAFGTSKDGGW